MDEEEVRIPRDVLQELWRDIEAYKAGNPDDDESWNEMLDALDRIHESLDAILALDPNPCASVKDRGLADYGPESGRAQARS